MGRPVFLVASVLWSLWACACGAPPAARPAAAQGPGEPDRVHYKEKQQAFSIIPPPGYCRERHPWHDVMFLGPREGDFSVNLLIDVQDDDRTPLSSAGRRVKTTLCWLLPEYLPLEEGMIRLADRPCYWLSGAFRWEARKVRNLQYFIRGDNGKVYILTFAAPQESFDRHRPLFEQCAMSLRIE